MFGSFTRIMSATALTSPTSTIHACMRLQLDTFFHLQLDTFFNLVYLHTSILRS